ncbi:MAG: RluA family pseudouridine synthase [Oscillospiraceae bacterium]|nr:RluA family pseudouridine synthase [Oscillospiraceae bacterium]
MENRILIFPAEFDGERLDKWLASQELGLTRTAVQELMQNGNVLVNQKAISKNYKARKQDEICILIPPPQELQITAQKIDLDIVYEDEDLLVVNKPQGMVVHPAAGNYENTLVNALLYHCKDSLSGINGVIRPGIVHRIDKNTSGLLIVAKNDTAHQGLAEQIKVHSFTREYEAIAVGKFWEKSGRIDAPIGRSVSDRKKMCVTEKNSKSAVTNYEILEQFSDTAHVKLILETGRTHQIRVHLAYLHHPVYGDDVYGKAIKGLAGQCLHARKIGFVHPRTEAYLEFERPAPEYFQKLLEKFRRMG